MKSVLNQRIGLALALTMASACNPVWADQAMIIGSGTDAFCKRWLDTRVNPKPQNADGWMTQCRAAAAKQDACARAAGYVPGGKATPATTACYETFQAELRAIPTGAAAR